MNFTLTLAKDLPPIQPDALVELEVNEWVEVPADKLAVFFLRDSFNRLGLDALNFKADPMFKGIPKGIVVHNRSPNPIELVKGKEIGELWLLAL